MACCDIHLKVDEELEKQGHVRLKCVGHDNPDCACRKDKKDEA